MQKKEEEKTKMPLIWIGNLDVLSTVISLSESKNEMIVSLKYILDTAYTRILRFASKSRENVK